MWKDYIEDLKKEFLGKKVTYQDKIHTITNVDYNGVIHIGTPGIAVYMPHEARKALIEEDKEMLVVREKEAGNIIERVNTIEEGLELIRQYEEEDKADGIYMEGFYEIAKDGITYEVDLKVDGVISAIDTVTAPEGYTAWDYIKDCCANADDEWNEMIANGEIIIREVE